MLNNLQFNRTKNSPSLPPSKNNILLHYSPVKHLPVQWNIDLSLQIKLTIALNLLIKFHLYLLQSLNSIQREQKQSIFIVNNKDVFIIVIADRAQRGGLHILIHHLIYQMYTGLIIKKGKYQFAQNLQINSIMRWSWALVKFWFRVPHLVPWLHCSASVLQVESDELCCQQC